MIAHEGARLKLSEPNSKKPLGPGEAWDDKLKFRCEFQKASDDHFYCLPEEQDLVTRTLYTDSGCTEPFTGIDLEPVPGVIAWTTWEKRIWAGFQWFPPLAMVPYMQYGAVGRPLFLADPVWGRVYETFPDGPCVPGNNGAVPETRFFRLQVLTLGDFVKAAGPEVRGAEGNRLRPRWTVGEDGSQVQYDFWDAKLGMPCRFGQSFSWTDRCTPHLPTFGFRSAFLSDRCDELGVLACGADNQQSRIGYAARVGRIESGEARYDVAMLGEPIPMQRSLPAFRFHDGKCEGSPPSFYAWYDGGDDIDVRCTLHRIARVVPAEALASNHAPEKGAGVP